MLESTQTVHGVVNLELDAEHAQHHVFACQRYCVMVFQQLSMMPDFQAISCLHLLVTTLVC